MVEKPFGWMKQIGVCSKMKLHGLAKVVWLFVFTCAACNLLWIPELRAERPEVRPDEASGALPERVEVSNLSNLVAR